MQPVNLFKSFPPLAPFDTGQEGVTEESLRDKEVAEILVALMQSSEEESTMSPRSEGIQPPRASENTRIAKVYGSFRWPIEAASEAPQAFMPPAISGNTENSAHPATPSIPFKITQQMKLKRQGSPEVCQGIVGSVDNAFSKSLVLHIHSLAASNMPLAFSVQRTNDKAKGFSHAPYFSFGQKKERLSKCVIAPTGSLRVVLQSEKLPPGCRYKVSITSGTITLLSRLCTK